MPSTKKDRRDAHHCHAKKCKIKVPPQMLMCKAHWFMVPMLIRSRVWKHYRVGQCDDKSPSKEWLAAADDAIVAVYKAERKRAMRIARDEEEE